MGALFEAIIACIRLSRFRPVDDPAVSIEDHNLIFLSCLSFSGQKVGERCFDHTTVIPSWISPLGQELCAVTCIGDAIERIVVIARTKAYFIVIDCFVSSNCLRDEKPGGSWVLNWKKRHHALLYS